MNKYTWAWLKRFFHCLFRFHQEMDVTITNNGIESNHLWCATCGRKFYGE